MKASQKPLQMKKIHQFSENEVHFEHVHVKKQRKTIHFTLKILQLKPAASVTNITVVTNHIHHSNNLCIVSV